jgi:hypothetical protein
MNLRKNLIGMDEAVWESLAQPHPKQSSQCAAHVAGGVGSCQLTAPQAGDGSDLQMVVSWRRLRL